MRTSPNSILFRFNEKAELLGEPFFVAGSFEQEQRLRGKVRLMELLIAPALPADVWFLKEKLIALLGNRP